jgi:hypothetical protein
MVLLLEMEGLIMQDPIGPPAEKQAPGAMHHCVSIPHPPASIARCGQLGCWHTLALGCTVGSIQQAHICLDSFA